MTVPSDCPFRVIIVGGGIAGLAMAHALTLANIDYIVLEKQPIVAAGYGSGIGIWPHNITLLEQFGVFQELMENSSPLHTSYHLDPEGREIQRYPLFDRIHAIWGKPFVPFLRSTFLDVLYQRLPNREKRVRTNCDVVSIDQDDKGVTVYMRDGRRETGDIVIGADGVHSRVREIMWQAAEADCPGIITPAEMTLLTTRYKCLFGISDLVPPMKSGDMLETHDTGVLFHIFTQPTLSFWFMYITLDKPTHWPEQTRYTEDDVDAVVKKYSKVHVTRDVLFEDMWKARSRHKLASLEEGVQKRWYWKRIVLLGDSAHKMTPNVAFGANNALQSVTVLANTLSDHISRVEASQDSSRSEIHPKTAEIGAIFAAYQKKRYGPASWQTWVSGYYTAGALWPTNYDRIMTYVPRYLLGIYEWVVVFFFLFLCTGGPDGLQLPHKIIEKKKKI